MLARFLQDVAQGRGAVDWTTWLPVALEATRGDAWATAWEALTDDDQASILDRLQADGSVFADTLVLLAARESGTVRNAQVREVLLLDAHDAGTRAADSLDAWRLRLRAQLSAAQLAEAEAAEAVVRLEAELAGLRGANVGGDYERMIQLQGELSALRANAERLDAFDWDAARAERDRTSARIDDLRARIDGQITEADRLRAELSDLGDEVRRIQPELASLTDAHTDASARVERLRREAATMEAEVAQLGVDSERLVTAQREHEQRVAGLRRDRALLTELESSPVAAQTREIARSVDELLASLPADEADRQVASRVLRSTS